MAHGRHIKVLGRGSAAPMRSVEDIKSFLEALVHALGMRALGNPHMYEVEESIEKLGAEPFEDEGGVTGVAVLSTSHCSIHTWPLREHTPEQEMFVLDVYSCRDFDPAVVERMLEKHLRAHSLKLTDLTHSLVYDVKAERRPLSATVH